MEILTVEEFIELVRSEPNRWVNYCEIILLRDGTILLARPSHTECVIYYACEVEEITRDDVQLLMQSDFMSPLDFYIDKYGLVCVWYNMLFESAVQGISNQQKSTLDQLTAEGLISIQQTQQTSEYSKYLRRNELRKS